MPAANFCAECGERLAPKGWRAWLRGRFCTHCAQRLGSFAAFRGLVAIALVALAAFCFGRYLRPSPPPLIIQRSANSPLSDLPLNVETDQRAPQGNASRSSDASIAHQSSDDVVYICGARTKKGTPCQRRVHAAGERCFQHKGLPAMLPVEKLIIKPDNSSR